MNPRYKPLLWTAAAIAVGVLVILAVRSLATGTDAASSPQVHGAQPAPARPGAGNDIPAATGTGSDAPPPWAQAPAVAGTTSSLSSVQAPRGTGPVTAQAAVDQTVAGVRLQAQQNTARIDGLLRDLDQAERSGQVPPDINLEALRSNLAIARRAQVLALELAETAQRADTPEQRQRHDAIINELQTLQGQLRYDLGPGAAGSVIPAKAQ
ncbi:hypothetical protein [Xanthomonas sp. XNM01]|uniref:hypothetical protein n=1 Tax=Xanthomonas sp. XNM01 TaxID=2769289 RepID=UPI0017817D84|nr:hypothetical protein [Xanthomonas sp. XNM01]MBD9370293.1 hypothetical protein [Xanthomonas sp. XNM01]